ncbi:MAG: hypothetical protein IKL49_12220 [Lachnospiraceae bacterium]|nr:hypothetical protein [Lachnospiraceae bacterium]
MYIEQLIDTIKKRPGMFMKEERIDYIYYFIAGYCSACHQSSKNDMDKMFCCWFWKWLVKWIEENMDSQYETSSAMWYVDIKRIAEDQQKEVALFFELSKEFFDDYKNKRGYFGRE